jgi:putative ABC transport system ATP-binding protein
MITLRGVSREYLVGGEPVRALRDVDLTIADGEYVAIMGPSGSGKSTLLNVLGCLDRPTSGAYVLDGRDVGSLDDRELSRIRAHTIGFVFQSFHLVPRLTAAGNVELPLVFAGVPRAERRSRVEEALASVGLSGRARHRPDQLSGGERQRVALARAIVMAPSVLLADEPTGNLDRASGRDIVALLESLNARGLTLLVVTHDPALGSRARRLVRLVDGAVASDETVAARAAPETRRAPEEPAHAAS